MVYGGIGATAAARVGAVAMLLRSVASFSINTPHTGALNYDPDQPKLPAAAITVEDSQLIARLAAQGPVTVHLRLESQQLPDAPSANVTGELRGRALPGEGAVRGARRKSRSPQAAGRLCEELPAPGTLQCRVPSEPRIGGTGASG